MALRYWVGGTDTWNNVAGTKWSATSGGAGGASAPTAADDVFFDGNSGTGTVTTASTAICLTANFTGFTGTFNAATNWTISTSLTLGASMTVSGTGNISKTGNGGTWTSNGKTYTGGLILPLGGGFTTAFADDWTFVGNVTAQAAAISITGSGGTRTITVGGNLSSPAGITCTNIVFVMNGSGALSGSYTGTTITINTTGTITQNACTFNGVTFTYTTASSFTSTANISFAGNCVMNNVSSLSFFSISFGAAGGQNVTINSDMYVTNGLSTSAVAGAINGSFTMYVGGNVTPTAGITGTATIELNGSTNSSISAGTIQNNLTINKDSGTTLTLTGNLTWGTTGRTLQYTSGTIVPGTTTVTIPNNASVTINGMTFYNLTLGTSTTITQNTLNTIQNTLTCNGTTTFAGTSGFTTSTFNAQTAASILTFSNINANPLAEYRITGNLTIIGTALSRITLQSAGSAAFTGTANGTSLTRASGTVPSIGMVVSQATGTAPTGFSALFPNRPVINGGSDPNFTLDLSVSPSTGSIAMRAGYKSVFILENNGVATQNVAYTFCQDIDSSLGQPILSFASNNDDQTTNVSLFRTINWGSLDPPPVQGRNYASVYVY
jgi:hypothetical protein